VQEVEILKTPLSFANLLSLLCLLIRETRGKKPLMDYNQSHVVTNEIMVKYTLKIVLNVIKNGSIFDTSRKKQIENNII
jgi:hypothetical protein